MSTQIKTVGHLTIEHLLDLELVRLGIPRRVDGRRERVLRRLGLVTEGKTRLLLTAKGRAVLKKYRAGYKAA